MIMLLPRKIDIERAKADAKRREIEEGIALAKKVQTIRELRIEQEEALRRWKEVTLKQIQQEIQEESAKKEDIIRQIDRAREELARLRKPLDIESNRLKEQSVLLVKQSEDLQKDREELEKVKKSLSGKQKDIDETIIKVKNNEKATNNYKELALENKNRAESELARARDYREYVEKESAKILTEAKKRKEEYEVGVRFLKAREKQVEQKERSISLREKTLERRIKNLQKLHQ